MTHSNNGISHRQGKVTRKYIAQIETDTLDNVVRNWPKSNRIFLLEAMADVRARRASFKALGPPNINTAYEGSVGAWILDDVYTGIVWVIYSDLHRKHAFMGTSIELVFYPMTDDCMVDALKRLCNFLNVEEKVGKC